MKIEMDQRTQDILEKALATAEMAIVAKAKRSDLILGTILASIFIVAVATTLIVTW